MCGPITMPCTAHYTYARFISRLNRFVGVVAIEGNETAVYIPNTGRLAELLIPGAAVVLTPVRGKFQYKIEFIVRNGEPVMIDSIRSNSLFHELLAQGAVPSLGSASVIRREPAMGKHRFDFELNTPAGSVMAELKSCTLFHRTLASFPDAVSSRAAEHVKALAETGRGMLIFFLLGSRLTRFVPNFHTDFHFYRTLMECRDRIDIRALSVVYGDNFSITGTEPVEILYPEVRPLGSYYIVLFNDRETAVTAGKLGTLLLKRGFYVYCGSAMGGLFERIARHRRKRKKNHWHIDYISREMKIIADIPIVGAERLECRLAYDLLELGGEAIEGAGSSDCRCRSHLFHFTENPLHRRELWEKVLEYRFGSFLL